MREEFTREGIKLMKAIVPGAAILFVLIFIPDSSYAQSGRKAPPPPKTDASTQPSGNSTADGLDNESRADDQLAGDGEIIEGDTLRVNTALVTVPVNVMDRNGKYVPNLQRRDFRVFDNGVERR